MRTQILSRNDSKANWASINPILGKGEIGLEIDTGLFKFGNGISNWSDLKYANDIPEVDLSTVTNSYKEATTLEGLGEGSVTGDVGIVKTLIGGDKYSYTCYVWDQAGKAWKAADGNYNAENVYFDEDLLTTVAVGNVKLDSTGQATIATTGKNLKDLWQTLYVAENKSFTVTKPSITVTGADSVNYLEIGSSSSRDVGITYEDGKYQYGYTTDSTQEEAKDAVTVVNNNTTGADVTEYILKVGDDKLSPKTEGGNSFTVESGVKTAKGLMKVVATATYDDGYTPVSNLKKMYPSKKITASTTSAVEKEVFRWYVPMYYGFRYSANVVADPAKVTSSVITSLTKVKDSKAYDQTIPTGATASGSWRQFFIAIPASYGKSKPSAKDSNNLTLTVNQADNISVTFGENTSVAYNVFYINNAADYDTVDITLAW